MNGVDFFNQRVTEDSEEDLLLDDFIDDTEEVEEERPVKRLRSRSSSSTEQKTSRQQTKIPSLENLDDCFRIVERNSENIVGRESEVIDILSLMLQPASKVYPLLIGPHGVGKSHVIKKLAQHPLMHQRLIYELDCRALIGRSSDENPELNAIQTLEKIKRSLSGSRTIVPVIHLRNIDHLVRKDRLFEYFPSLVQQSFSVIGSCTSSDGDENTISVVRKLRNYDFSPIEIKECGVKELEVIIRNFVAAIPSIKYEQNALDLAIKLSEKYLMSLPQPLRTIRMVQECAVWHSLIVPHSSKRRMITPSDVAKFISTKTGIPAEDLLEEFFFDEERFSSRLNEMIIGQEHAVKEIAEAVGSAKLNLFKQNKPWGRFLFVGPTGVGKTELAKQIAHILFHNEKNLIIFNCSEFKEEHTVSNLLGSPKGYDSNETGGLLTEALLKTPYSVVLFDEFEKAHQDAQRIFLQVFAEGTLMDRRGIIVDCTKAVFIMTSNIGAELFFEGEPEKTFNPEKMLSLIEDDLKDKLSPELYARFSKVISFQAIGEHHLPLLSAFALKQKKKELLGNTEIDLEWSDEVIEWLTHLEYDVTLGARNYLDKIDRTVNEALKTMFRKHKRKVSGKIRFEVDRETNTLFCMIPEHS